MAEEDRDETAEGRSKLETMRAAPGGLVGKLTGRQFREQFERFTNVVETTVVGIHRDEMELNRRLEKIERATPATPSAPPNQRLVVAAFVFSLIAAVLAVAALVVSL